MILRSNLRLTSVTLDGGVSPAVRIGQISLGSASASGPIAHEEKAAPHQLGHQRATHHPARAPRT